MPLPDLYRLMKRRQREYRQQLFWPLWTLDFLEFVPIPGLIIWGVVGWILRTRYPAWTGLAPAFALFGLAYLALTRLAFWLWPLRDGGAFLEWYALDREIEQELASLTVEECLEPEAEEYLLACLSLESELIRILRFYSLRFVGSSHRANLARLQQFRRLHVTRCEPVLPPR